MHVKSATVKSRGETAKRMAGDAVKFLGTLTREQREKASFEVSSDERMNWHYIPRPRKGLSFKEMDGLQRRFAFVLIAAGLSRDGWRKAMGIMGLEKILGEMEGKAGRFDTQNNANHIHSVWRDLRNDWGEDLLKSHLRRSHPA